MLASLLVVLDHRTASRTSSIFRCRIPLRNTVRIGKIEEAVPETGGQKLELESASLTAAKLGTILIPFAETNKTEIVGFAGRT